MSQENLETIKKQLNSRGLTIVSITELERLRKAFHGTDLIHKKI